MARNERALRVAGFTLIELMMVVAIIGILAAIAIPKFAELLRKANEGSTKGSLGALRSAITIYYGDLEGQYPNRIDTLTVSGKYLSTLPYTKLNPYHSSYNVGSYTNVQPNPEYGSWWYNNVTGDPGMGTVRVNCTHTDTKGTVWTAY